MPAALDLEAALDRARAGAPEGYEALFHHLAAPVAGYLRARSVSDPDGLTNEVFVRAFRTLHTFRGDGERLRAWIFTIAHHAAVDDRRRRNRRVQQTAIDDAPEAVQAAPGGDVEHEVMARLARERVEALLAQLSPDQREIILLRVVADLSVEQTAAVAGKSYEAVKALQRRGLAALRRILTESSEEAVPR